MRCIEICIRSGRKSVGGVIGDCSGSEAGVGHGEFWEVLSVAPDRR